MAQYFEGIGRRKEGTARVRISDGSSRIVAMSFCEPRSWTRVLSS